MENDSKIGRAAKYHDEHIKEIVNSYNECIRNILHIQQSLSYNPIREVFDNDEWSEISMITRYNKIHCMLSAEEWEEFKQMNEQQRADYISQIHDNDICYECKMEKFGLNLLKAIRETYGKEAIAQNINTSGYEDRNQSNQDVLHLLQLKNKQKDMQIKAYENELRILRESNDTLRRHIILLENEVIKLQVQDIAK